MWLLLWILWWKRSIFILPTSLRMVSRWVGLLASAAAVHHGLGALVLDHTFTSASAVAKTYAVACAKGISEWIPAWLASSVAEGAMGAALECGVNVDLGRAGSVTTDGLSSVDKVKRFKHRLVVIYGTKDHIMPVSFADDFERAYKGYQFTRIEIDEHLTMSKSAGWQPGGHRCDQFENEQKSHVLAVALGIMPKEDPHRTVPHRAALATQGNELFRAGMGMGRRPSI